MKTDKNMSRNAYSEIAVRTPTIGDY